MAYRGLWWTRFLFETIWRLLAHDFGARRQVHHRRATCSLGADAVSECRGRKATKRCRIPSGLRRVFGMGVAYWQRKLSTKRSAATQHAGSSLVVGLQCDSGL